MKNWKERRRRSYSAKGWKPPGGLSQVEIPLHYEDTGAQDLSHFLEGQTAALWDVHEEKHKMMHSEDIPALTEGLTRRKKIQTQNTQMSLFAFIQNAQHLRVPELDSQNWPYRISFFMLACC